MQSPEDAVANEASPDLEPVSPGSALAGLLVLLVLLGLIVAGVGAAAQWLGGTGWEILWAVPGAIVVAGGVAFCVGHHMERLVVTSMLLGACAFVLHGTAPEYGTETLRAVLGASVLVGAGVMWLVSAIALLAGK